MARLRPPPEPEDAFKGRRIAGALLKRRLAVLPTRTVYLARHEKLGRDVRVELFTAAFGEANYDYVRRLSENGKIIREKTWTDTIPRDFQ